MTELVVTKTTQSLMQPIATPKELIAYHEQMTKIIKEALKENVDFGIIPGTKKPTLYKPGAERINIAFGTHPEFELIEKEVDHDRKNETRYAPSFGLYRYIYKCKIVRSMDGIIVGEGEGSCSTLESKYITRPRDCENTVLKMAQKRAFLAATLHTFGLSDRFTQDLEDMPEIVEDQKKAQFTGHRPRVPVAATQSSVPVDQKDILNDIFPN